MEFATKDEKIYYILPIHLTEKLDTDSPLTQWAAVMTHKGWTNVPPQNWFPDELYLNITCHGQLLIGAADPPTIRPWTDLIPHAYDGGSKE